MKEVLGVAPEVVTGDEEASAVLHRRDQELSGTRRPTRHRHGGGSTEFVLGGPEESAAPVR